MKRLTKALMVAGLVLTMLTALTDPAMAHSGIDWRTNKYRAWHGLRQLPVSSVLYQIARQRSRQIVGNFSHDFWWWGRSGCDWVGENIAYRRPKPDNVGLYFFRAWRDSPPHRVVMLGRWSVMASAVYLAPDGGAYAVQLFGSGCDP